MKAANNLQIPKQTVPSILMEERTYIEHFCHLNYKTPATHRRLTGIVCTLSRSSQSTDIILQLLRIGMRIARLNFTYDSQEYHVQTLNNIREATLMFSKEMGFPVPVGIALETKGPEIRTGFMSPYNQVELRRNDTIHLSINKDYMEKGNRDIVYIDCPSVIESVTPGTQIHIFNGAIILICRDVVEDALVCVVEKGGTLSSRMSVAIKDVEVNLPTLSEKDCFDIKFGVIHSVDYIFASDIRSAAGISEIRTMLGEKGKDIKVIASIKTIRGLENMDEIIEAADGVLVLRSSLGVYIPMSKLFLAQKAIIARCNRVGKPVICGTRILESMVKFPYPTSSEIADIGNAILDGSDCILLSSETAVGNHPVECIKVLNEVIRESETALWYSNLFKDLVADNPSAVDAPHAVAMEAVETSRKSLASAIVVLTTSGRAAHLVAKYKPRCPILALTRCPRTARQCNMYRGIVPILYTETINDDWLEDTENRVQFALTIGKKMGIIQSGDTIVVLSTWKGGAGFTNNMRIVYAFFEEEWIECMVKMDKRNDERDHIERNPL